MLCTGAYVHKYQVIILICGGERHAYARTYVAQHLFLVMNQSKIKEGRKLAIDFKKQVFGGGACFLT